MKKYLLGTALVAALAFGNVMASTDYENFKNGLKTKIKALSKGPKASRIEDSDVDSFVDVLVSKFKAGQVAENFKQDVSGLNDFFDTLSYTTRSGALDQLEAELTKPGFEITKTSIVLDKASFKDVIRKALENKSAVEDSVHKNGIKNVLDNFDALLESDALVGLNKENIINDCINDTDNELKKITSSQYPQIKSLVTDPKKLCIIKALYDSVVLREMVVLNTAKIIEAEEEHDDLMTNVKSFVGIVNKLTAAPTFDLIIKGDRIESKKK